MGKTLFLEERKAVKFNLFLVSVGYCFVCDKTIGSLFQKKTLLHLLFTWKKEYIHQTRSNQDLHDLRFHLSGPENIW